MRFVVIALALIAIPCGLGFAYKHTLYWTQSGNCSPCNPELFHQSLMLGGSFAVCNLLIWLGISSDFADGEGLFGKLRSIAQRTLVWAVGALVACSALIGLAVLPVVTVIAALFYSVALTRHLLERQGG